MTIIAMRVIDCENCSSQLTINEDRTKRISCDSCEDQDCEDSYGCRKCDIDHCLNCLDLKLEKLGRPIISK